MENSALTTASVPFQSLTNATLFLDVDVDESFARTLSIEETRCCVCLHFS